MEKFGTILWWILRAIILLGLLGLTIGTGICGALLFTMGQESAPLDGLTIAVLAGIALLTVFLGWVAWIVGRAMFRKPTNDAER
jgi:hypothetical protein